MKRLFVLVICVCFLLSLASCNNNSNGAGATDTGKDTAGMTSAETEEMTVVDGGQPGEPEVKTLPVELPSDFSFSLVWGVYGISSYDSATGKLVKTTDTIDGNKDKFVAEVKLDEEMTKRFYDLIEGLDLETYPSEYDPGCGYSAPCANLSLSYTANGRTVTVKSYNISLEYRTADNPKGQAYLNVINEIADYLTSTPEWKALPDYELFYD